MLTTPFPLHRRHPSRSSQTSTEKWNDFSLIDYPLKSQGESDIDVHIDYCGICASDLHTITGGWGVVKDLPVRLLLSSPFTDRWARKRQAG